MRSTTSITALGIMLLATIAPAETPINDSFLIRAGRILTLDIDPDRWEIEDGVMAVAGGQVLFVASADGYAKILDESDVEYRAFLRALPVLEFPDATIMPGMVAAISDLGGSHRGDESVAAGYRATDAFDRYGNYAKQLAAGVTTVHVNPGTHRLVTGQGGVVKLGGPARARVLRSVSDLAVNLDPGSLNPPQDVTYPFPASADVPIVPGIRQRPASRMGQLLALQEAIDAAMAGKQHPQQFSLHGPALARAWKEKTPVRIRADRAANLLAAVKFLEEQDRDGYLVGGAEAGKVADRLREAKVPLVYQPRDRFRTTGGDLGSDPDALDEADGFDKLQGIKIALAPPAGGMVADLRLAAIRAAGNGLGRRRAIEAITRTPAEILGVDDRVGKLVQKADADFLVLSGDPLSVSSHVRRVYINGGCVFQPPANGPLVIKAGTIWTGSGLGLQGNNVIRNGQILIEDGKIVAVGRSVPHPPFARVIDAGPDAFVTPGLIDAHGHLGLRGDRSTVGNEIRFKRMIGVADAADLRVCRAGITSVLMAPYGTSSSGSPGAVIKTAGTDRDRRVLRDPAVVLLDVSKADPLTVAAALDKPLAAGKKYLDSWVKYEKDLKEFLEKKEKGETVDKGSVVGSNETKKEETKEESDPDPITGTWKATVSGGPLPQTITLTIVIQLIGPVTSGKTTVEGRITESNVGFTGRISGTFEGKHLSAVIEVQVPGVDEPPKLEADLVEDDQLKGKILVAGVSAQFEAKRTDKKLVEIKVTRTRRTKAKDGRPLPPTVNEAMEPLKSLLEKKIPVVVKVSTPAQIREVLAVLVDKHELSVVLLGAEGAAVHAEKLAQKKVTVIVPPTVLRTRQYREYNQADVLARRGVPIAFQSNVEDGARHLPSVVLYAVERGLDADEALTALTIGAAKALKIDDRVGSIEPGKDADLVIFSSHPMTGPSRVRRVIVNGEEIRR